MPEPGEGSLLDNIGAILRRNIFAAAGIALLLLGVSFLFPLIKGLISPPVRLALASILGAALVGTGYYRARGSRDYGQMLEGGGMAILYLTLYAAYRLYGYVSAGPAFAGFVALSAATVALSRNPGTINAMKVLERGRITISAMNQTPHQGFPSFRHLDIISGSIFNKVFYR